MPDWPNRPKHRHQGERVARVSATAIKRLPVAASAPRLIPQPSLTPRSRRDAFAASIVLGGTLLVLLALVTFSIAHFHEVGILGKVFVATIIVLTLIAVLLYVVGLGLYVLPVLFGVRRPEVTPPPVWPGIGDRH